MNRMFNRPLVLTLALISLLASTSFAQTDANPKLNKPVGKTCEPVLKSLLAGQKFKVQGPFAGSGTVEVEIRDGRLYFNSKGISAKGMTAGGLAPKGLTADSAEIFLVSKSGKDAYCEIQHWGINDWDMDYNPIRVSGNTVIFKNRKKDVTLEPDSSAEPKANSDAGSKKDSAAAPSDGEEKPAPPAK